MAASGGLRRQRVVAGWQMGGRSARGEVGTEPFAGARLRVLRAWQLVWGAGAKCLVPCPIRC
eukprot:7634344-Alexandrium_andersonii.AAC.1